MTDTKTIKVGLLGLGTVGTGVYKLIGRRSEEMQQKTGAALEIKKILVQNMKKVSKQQSTISNKIRILTLPEDIQEVIVSNRLTERHARALLKLKNESDRRRVIERVVHNHLNVKQTEKLIDDILLSRSAPPKGCGKISGKRL